MAGPTATREQVQQMLEDMRKGFVVKQRELSDKYWKLQKAEESVFAQQLILEMKRRAKEYGYTVELSYTKTSGGYLIIGTGLTFKAEPKPIR